MRLRQLMARQMAARRGAQGFPQPGWKPGGPEGAQRNMLPADFAQRVIDAVNTSAGHDPKNEAFFHFICARAAVFIGA